MIGDQALLLGLLAGSAVVIAGIALTMMLRGLEARTLEQRVASLSRSSDGRGVVRDVRAAGAARRLLSWIGKMVREHAMFCPERDIAALEDMIASAGFRPRRVLPVLLGIKIMLAVAIPAAGILYAEAMGLPANETYLVTVIALPLGLLGPNWIITLVRWPYAAALRRGVPDALDLLAVCSEAGMELDSALEYVGLVITHANAATAAALRTLLDDVRVLPDWRDAFRNFAERTEVESARRIFLIVAISVRYGTPLSQGLRALAIEVRQDRMAALEAKAACVPVLLILPLLLFIVPALVIILTGPVMPRLMMALECRGAG
ncbi:type II secretion system F family protein [Acidisphaera sp. S103]|uniref:type II secretion system F family protein n=1 Tax=Acidisphaera sp. S103 TaxID=1747223 RepID=UPI00131B600D|nr:type II secretion system F family protein [Acidisphaera sp. S103]